MGIVKFCTLKLSTEEKKIGLVTIPEDKLNFNFKIWPRVFLSLGTTFNDQIDTSSIWRRRGWADTLSYQENRNSEFYLKCSMAS